jgi:hypothetical protein
MAIRPSGKKFRKVKGRWQWVAEKPKEPMGNISEIPRVAAFARNARLTYVEALKILNGPRNRRLKSNYIVDSLGGF